MQFFRNPDGCFIRADAFEKYKDQFILPNLKKALAVRMQMWGAHKLPDKINHFKPSKELPGYIKVPVGISGFEVSKFILSYDSVTITHPQLVRDSYTFQSDKVDELLRRSVGLLHASTGSGKTQMICEILTRLRRNTLIVVQNLTQMQQMVEDIDAILGVRATQVSGKKYSKKEVASWYPYITVCSIESRDKIDPKDYGLILLDEADTYLGADERREWVWSLSPEYMYALTGTVQVNNVDSNVFRLYYGPTTELKLLHNTPDYVQIPSTFEYYLDDIKHFHELKEALYTAEDRNELIVSTVKENIKGRKGIVFTEHVAHAKLLAEKIERLGIRTYVLIGEVKDEERERIRQEAKDYGGEVVIVGSVKILGRGFDLPELSFGLLTTCERFQSNIQQYLGRCCRDFPGKPHPIFFDIVDRRTHLLYGQAKSRLATYKKAFPEGKIISKL